MPEHIADLSPEQRALLIERLRKRASQQEKQVQRNIPQRPAPRDQSLPLSFAQERLWVLQQMEYADTSYNIIDAVHLREGLDFRALLQTLNEIVQRHEILRTTFESCDGVPVQIIAPQSLLTMPLLDIQGLSAHQQEQQYRDLVAEEDSLPFNLRQWPLMRCYLLRRGPQDHIFLFSIHHIIFDGWSQVIFIRELVAFYEAFCHNKVSPLPPLPLQYADFVLWQRQQFHGQVLDALLTYWREQLAGISPVLELPGDRPRSPVASTRGAKLDFIQT